MKKTLSVALVAAGLVGFVGTGGAEAAVKRCAETHGVRVIAGNHTSCAKAGLVAGRAIYWMEDSDITTFRMLVPGKDREWACAQTEHLLWMDATCVHGRKSVSIRYVF